MAKCFKCKFLYNDYNKPPCRSCSELHINYFVLKQEMCPCDVCERVNTELCEKCTYLYESNFMPLKRGCNK